MTTKAEYYEAVLKFIQHHSDSDGTLLVGYQRVVAAAHLIKLMFKGKLGEFVDWMIADLKLQEDAKGVKELKELVEMEKTLE